MITNKTIFITGGAGFIANKLISKLVEDNKIVVYDNYSRDTLSGSGYADHKNITIIKGDVLDYDAVLEAMKGADIVVHAAAIAGIDTVIKDPVRTMRVNMIGSANVLEAARVNGIKDRFIDFSTSEIFGSYAYRSSETDSAVAGNAGEARWTYAVSKLASEHMSMAYSQQYNLPVVVVRPFNVYGPGQTGEGAMQIFIKMALKNQDIHIDGDGSQIRAWCFIDDFIDCLMRCIEDPKAVGQTFNIGNARTVVTIYHLAKMVIRVLNSETKILFDPPLSADVALRIPDVTKAEKVLGFKAQIDLEEGIKKTAEWFKKQGLV